MNEVSGIHRRKSHVHLASGVVKSLGAPFFASRLRRRASLLQAQMFSRGQMALHLCIKAIGPMQ